LRIIDLNRFEPTPVVIPESQRRKKEGTSMNRSDSQVVCLKSDVSIFRRAGFTPSVKPAGPGTVRLVHKDPNKAFDALIELMAIKRTPFLARIGRTANWGVRRLAFAGLRLVVLGNPAPHSDEVRWNRQVRAAFRRLASRPEVR
jgi:hypothetical protein